MAASTSGGEPADAIDSTQWKLRLPVAALLAEGIFQQLVDLPVRFNLVLTVGGEEIRIGGEPHGPPVIQPIDRPFKIVTDVDGFERARETGDAKRLLGMFGSRELDAYLVVVNDPAETGVRWIRTVASYRERLEGSWLATLESIFSRGLRETLVINDATTAVLAAKDLYVCGPDAVASALAPGELTTSGFSRQWWEAHRGDLPVMPIPNGLVPSEEFGASLQGLGAVTGGIGVVLAWLWLADQVDASHDVPRVSFVGQRVAEFDLPVSPRDDPGDELALWAWAVEEKDPGRYYAVQQAVSLAVFSAADLPKAAKPSLGTARTLLNALRQGQMTEAMATRRSVRDGAVSAGRAAADAGRTAGAKSLERVIVQAAAGAGILIAKSSSALSSSAATWLLILVGALLVASAVVALVVEYPAAYGLLGSFGEDLSLYQDTLSDQDIEGIEKMQSLKEARCSITKSLVVTVTVLLAAMVALVIAITKT